MNISTLIVKGLTFVDESVYLSMKPVQLQSSMCIGTIGYEESLMHGSTNLYQYCSSKRVINLTFSISLVLSHVYI